MNNCSFNNKLNTRDNLFSTYKISQQIFTKICFEFELKNSSKLN